jgi:hypothetical protein
MPHDRRPLTISGVVRDPQGRAIANASVYFTRGPAPMPDIAALTGDDGSFVLSVPAPGDYQIGSSAEGFDSAETGVSIGQSESVTPAVELNLRPTTG